MPGITELTDGVARLSVSEGAANATKIASPPDREDNPLVLKNPVYNEITEIARTVHSHDAQLIFNQKKFIGVSVNKKYKTKLPKSGKFAWFRGQDAKSSDVDTHDWYGNFKFTFDLLKFLQSDPQIKMFLIDLVNFVCTSASRILLTRKAEYQGCRELKLESLVSGDPILYEDGKLRYAVKHTRKNTIKRRRNRHQVEVVIDLETIDGRELYRACEVTAVNHSRANEALGDRKYGFHQCLKYNSAKRTNCPSSWTAEQANEKLATLKV